MISYRLDYTIYKVLKNSNYSPTEAKTIFEKISIHKWYVSERLGRDVGLLVATLDYFTNIRDLPSIPRPIR